MAARKLSSSGFKTVNTSSDEHHGTVSAEVKHISCLYGAGELYLPVVEVCLSMLHIS